MTDPVHELADGPLKTRHRFIELTGTIVVGVRQGEDPVEVARNNFDNIDWEENPS